MGNPRQLIEASVGPGAYDEWQGMDRNVDVEIKRYERLQRRLSSVVPSRLFDQAASDLYVLGDLSNTYRQCISRLSANLPVADDRIFQAHDLCEEALEVAVGDNDLIDGVFGAGLFGAFVLFPSELLKAQLNAMSLALPPLVEELKKAERELTNAHNKRAFHLAVSFFEAMFPELKLASRVAVYLLDVAVDKALAPDDTSTFDRYAGDVTPGVKQLSEAVHHIKTYSETAREVAEQTGKIATVATFYFDFKEIGEGEERVEKLEKLVEKVKDASDKLKKTISDNQPVFDHFLRDYDRILHRIEDAARSTASLRDGLNEDIALYNYKRGAGVPWLMSPYRG